MTNRIDEYVGAEYKKGGDIRPTIKNKEQYAIKSPTSPVTTTTTTEKTFDTMVLNMEVDLYVKRKSMIEETIQ